MSGCLRITPVPEQGASNNILSNKPSFQMFLRFCAFKQSNCILVSDKLKRFKLSLILLKRIASESTATQFNRSDCDSKICVVFPPGAAQASKTICLGFSNNKEAANCAAVSCIETSPSIKPESLITGH